MRKIFENHKSNKVIVSRTYKELSKFSKKTIQFKNEQKIWTHSQKKIDGYQIIT